MGYGLGMMEKEELKYRELLAEISSMYESTMIMGVTARRQHKVKTFWRMGRRLMKEGRGRSTYGERVLERLAQDLTAQYGAGFKGRTVRYIRDFGRAYEESDLVDGLSWNHYKLLMGVDDAALREALAERVAAEGIPVAQLRTMVKRGDPLGEIALDLDRLLAPRQARMGLARLLVDSFGSGSGFLDLGFYCMVPVRSREMKGLAHRAMVRISGVAGAGNVRSMRLKEVRCGGGERYCYDGVMIDVVDGDTVLVRLHLGLGVYHSVRLRLRGVNAPELATAEGQKAQAFVKGRVKPGDSVRVLTYGLDTYGRWIGDLFCNREELFMNRALIEGGLARYVDMGV